MPGTHSGLWKTDGSYNAGPDILSLATQKAPKCRHTSLLAFVFYVHVSFIYIFEDLLSILEGTWEAQIGSKPSQAKRMESEPGQEL